MENLKSWLKGKYLPSKDLFTQKTCPKNEKFAMDIRGAVTKPFHFGLLGNTNLYLMVHNGIVAEFVGKKFALSLYSKYF